MITVFYAYFTCTIGSIDYSFEVNTGVRQECAMSALLFNMAVDWPMRQTTGNQPRGIRWTPVTTLEVLAFADDLALLSHAHQHMQEKTSILNRFSQQLGLMIKKQKTEVMTLNIPSPSLIQVDGVNLS